MSLIIREFQSRDLEQVQECLIELQEHERKSDDDRLPGKQIAERYGNHLLNEVKENNGKLFVAERDSFVVGFVAVWVEEHLEIGKKELYVSDLAVLSEYRGMGIGKMLMERAERYARELGLLRVTLNVLSGNTLAYGFYKQCGYADAMIGMVKKW